VYQDGAYRAALYRYRTTGVLERVIGRREPAPESGGGTIGSLSQGLGAGPAGAFYFRAAVVDGAIFGYAIYATRTTPAVTWASPAPVPAGTPLAGTQLNATADVAGTFAYTPDTGTVLPPGVHTLSVTFTPTNTVVYEPATTTVSMQVIAAAGTDFTGDVKADILWRHTTSGNLYLWPMDGAAPGTESYVGRVGDAAWQIRSTADFTGDGQADLLWRHTGTGAMYLWPFVGGVAQPEEYVGTVPVAYDIVATADFSGDGKADLLWRHATRGEVWIWPMNGTTVVSETYVDTVPDTGYEIAGTGDYNGDGKADILWRHATRGEVWVWLMNGTSPLSQTWVANVADVGYQIVKVK
jgi:hypothetical protein